MTAVRIMAGMAGAVLAATVTIVPASAAPSPASAVPAASTVAVDRNAGSGPSTSLFVVSGASGTVSGIGRDTGKEQLTLTLTGVRDHATQFTDRPIRKAYVLSTRDLVARWDRWFASSPPNAVLTFNVAGDPTPRSIVVTLRNPRYDRRAGTLRFSARHIHRRPDTSPDAIQQVALPKRRPPARFLRGSLFIDSVPNGCTFVQPIICPGVDLVGQDLRNMVLTRANLSLAQMFNANLTGANLSGAILFDANLWNATMRNTRLDGAWANGSSMIEADLTGASLLGAQLTSAELTSANLTNANLTNASLTNAHLTGANLTGAVLQNVDLRGANLAGADLTGADLGGADLSGATWTDGRICGPAGWGAGECL